MINKILQLSLDEVKRGYSLNPDNKTYTCLVCGREFEAGEVFPLKEGFMRHQRQCSTMYRKSMAACLIY
jgi:hypothetical protein